jgi:hypothetical protein
MIALLVACVAPETDVETDAIVDTDVPADGSFDVDGLARGLVVWVPSASAGDVGLATMVVWPNEAPRYPTGAPVVVEVAGGGGAGDIGVPDRIVGYDLPGAVHLRFALPGGGRDPWVSGGAFDQRGASSRVAVQDLLAFAHGETRLADGRSLADLVGPIDPAAVVLLGNSHGGNLAVAALSEAGDACGLVLWETPVSDVFVTVDLGSVEGDPDKVADADGDGIPWDDARHPAYAPGACTARGCGLDYGKLVHDRGGWFRDGDGDGARAQPLDANADGRLAIDEDFAYGSYLSEDGRLAGSVPFTVALTAQASAYPPDMLSLADAIDYWSMRTALPRLPALATRLPNLQAIYVATSPDHVQATPDHAHVRLAYDGLRSAGLWARLNPDEAYVRAMIGGSAALPETPANATLDDTAFSAALVNDKARAASEALRKAAVLEIADRCVTGDRADNLERPLFPPPQLR